MAVGPLSRRCRHGPDRRVGRARRAPRAGSSASSAGISTRRTWRRPPSAARSRPPPISPRRLEGAELARRRRTRHRAAGPGARRARRERARLHGHRRRLDEGRRLRGRRGRRPASSAAIRSAARRRAGRSGRRAELFEGATWFLTPVAATEPDSFKVLHGFVSALGAVPVAIDPEAHDRLVAVTSHLPHALANVLLNQAGGSRIDGHEPLAAAGGSLRDMTRVAGANPRIWVDIFLENREALAALARRAPAPGRAGGGGARGRRRGLPRALDRRGLRRTGGGSSRRPTRTPASSSGCACTCPTGRA